MQVNYMTISVVQVRNKGIQDVSSEMEIFGWILDIVQREIDETRFQL